MKSTIKILILLCIAIFSQGCATAYQNGMFSLTGGYYEEDGPGDLVKINFSGNGYITGEKVAQFNLYRCAEYTKENGKSHFIAYNSLWDAALDRRASSTTLGFVGGKPFSFVFILLRDEYEFGTMEADTILAEYQHIVHPQPQSTTENEEEGDML